METTISVLGKNIRLTLTQHKVKLVNNNELTALLAGNVEAATDALVAAIKTAFRQQHNREFNISDNSIAVEIWGHIYAESFAAAIKSLSPFAFVDGVADRIIGHCEVIDIGESGRDNNRFIWDRLAAFKSGIAALLPKTVA